MLWTPDAFSSTHFAELGGETWKNEMLFKHHTVTELVPSDFKTSAFSICFH